jgi:acyl-CoA reductase-like NAD-dependent aldehyde dehydrogenase
VVVRAGGQALWALRLRAIAESPDTFGQTLAEAEGQGAGELTGLVAEAAAARMAWRRAGALQRASLPRRLHDRLAGR